MWNELLVPSLVHLPVVYWSQYSECFPSLGSINSFNLRFHSLNLTFHFCLCSFILLNKSWPLRCWPFREILVLVVSPLPYPWRYSSNGISMKPSLMPQAGSSLLLRHKPVAFIKRNHHLRILLVNSHKTPGSLKGRTVYFVSLVLCPVHWRS